MDLKQAHSRDAYFVLDAISNFNNYLAALITGVDSAQAASSSFTNQWTIQFSYPTNPASTSRILEILHEIQGGLLILLTIASVAVPGIGEVTLTGDAVATAKTIGAYTGAAGGMQSGIFATVTSALSSVQ